MKMERVTTKLTDLVRASVPGTVPYVVDAGVCNSTGRRVPHTTMINADAEDITVFVYLLAVMSMRRDTVITALDMESLAGFGVECNDTTLNRMMVLVIDLVTHAVHRDIIGTPAVGDVKVTETLAIQRMSVYDFTRLREQVRLMISLHGLFVRLDHIQRAYTNTDCHYSTVAFRKDVDNA